jgi:hypothetical protein
MRTKLEPLPKIKMSKKKVSCNIDELQKIMTKAGVNERESPAQNRYVINPNQSSAEASLENSFFQKRQLIAVSANKLTLKRKFRKLTNYDN